MMKVETFNKIVSGLNSLREQITDEVRDDETEHKEVLGCFERMFNAAYEESRKISQRQ